MHPRWHLAHVTVTQFSALWHAVFVHMCARAQMSHVHVGWKCKRGGGKKVFPITPGTSLIFSAVFVVHSSPAGQSQYQSHPSYWFGAIVSHLRLSCLCKLLSLSYKLQMIWPMKVWPQCSKLCWLGFLMLKDYRMKSNNICQYLLLHMFLTRMPMLK